MARSRSSEMPIPPESGHSRIEECKQCHFYLNPLYSERLSRASPHLPLRYPEPELDPETPSNQMP